MIFDDLLHASGRTSRLKRTIVTGFFGHPESRPEPRRQVGARWLPVFVAFLESLRPADGLDRSIWFRPWSGLS
jgi:hypothetical protein